MKLATSVKTLAAAAVLSASASFAMAAVDVPKLLPASVTGIFNNVSLGSFSVLSISNVTGSFGYSPSIVFPNGTLTLGAVTFSGSAVSGLGGPVNFIGNTFSLSNLLAGNYKVFASGSVSDGGMGVVGALVNVTPVPEPETYAMLLAGLGIIGAIARRRKQSAV